MKTQCNQKQNKLINFLKDFLSVGKNRILLFIYLLDAWVLFRELVILKELYYLNE